METRTTLHIIIGLSLVMSIVSCKGKNDPESTPEAKKETTITIGYGAPELSGGQGVIMSGLVSRAEEQGWTVVRANANSDSRVQAEQIEYFLSQGVDVIVVVPVDSQGICESVKKVKAAGIPFYTIDRAPIGCEINMTVLADNYLAGVQAGREMVKLLTDRYDKPQGTILELQGDLDQNVAQLRGGGFHAVVDQYQDIEVISKPTEWQSEQFASVTQEVVTNRDIDGIYLHSDCIGIPVVLPILEQLGKKILRHEEGHIFLAGVDGCPEALQAIRDGYADQASSQPLPDFGMISSWIRNELNAQEIEAGEVVEEGALWSPATVERSETGWQVLLATTSVTAANVDEPRLWGNQ